MEVNSLIKSSDFHAALPLLKNMTSDQLSQLTFPDKCTPLHDACRHGRVDVAQQLITHCKYSIESKDGKGHTPLHTAAQYGQVSTLKYLLHNLFINEESSLSLKCDSTLAHTLAFMFQLKLLDRHKDVVGNTPLHSACVHGQLDIVQLLTREIGCDPNDTNSEGLSCLHLASQHGHLPLVRYLIEEVGSDVTLEDEHGMSPTYLAAGGGHLDILKYLIGEKGADPHYTTCKEWKTTEFSMASGRSLVHTASREGHLHVVRYLVEQHGCDSSHKDDRGTTPLYLACKQGHMDIVTYLITERICDPNCINNYGRTCLHAACLGGHLDVVKYLLDIHQCDPLCTDKDNSTTFHMASRLAITHKCSILVRDNDNNTPLHYAALHGHLKVIKFIIEDMKCDPDSKGQFERTPLHHASYNGHLEVVKYLVETHHHCNPLCTDKNNSTPLHMAAAQGQLEVLSYFAITRNCSILIRNNYNDTPLHSAALHGHLKVIRFIIENMKCDPNCKGELEKTPLHYASEGGHLDVVKYLVETHHCNPLCTDKNNNTPLHKAATFGRLEVLTYFAITQNCSILIRNNHDNTPLHYAALNGHLKVVKFIIEVMQCDPNIKGYCKNIPLHHASQNGHLEIVRYFVEAHRCNPLCTDKNFSTPLHLAAAHGHLEVLSYFATTHNCNFYIMDNYYNTPLSYSTQLGHHEVESYLLRATTTKPVITRDIISPSLNVFVVGNSGSGKSTLVKALSAENSILGSLVTVKDVTPLTAGIVTSEINSQVFGSVNIYDFAGHEEYYASHEMIFQQTSHPLVLLTVDISLPQQTIEKQLLYWLSLLSNSQTNHVIIIGSHDDQVNSIISYEVYVKVRSLISSNIESSIKYHGFVHCDCRYAISDSLSILRMKLNSVCRSIQQVMAVNESNDSNKLCASLMYYLKHNMAKHPTITVKDVLKNIQEAVPMDLVNSKLVDQSLLIQTCQRLSSNGHLLYIVHNENPEKNLLVLSNSNVLEKVHACLTDIKKRLSNEFGIVEESQLTEILSESLKDILAPEQAIKYLIVTQFCSKIAPSQLLFLPDNVKNVKFYFFPNLVSASRPGDLLPPHNHKYTHLYTWCLKCYYAWQFFTPRYLHTLFIQLTKCERNGAKSECIKIWKNGILLVHSNGTRSIIEVTDQTTRVYLTIQCVEGCESQLVKQRSHLISFIKHFTKKTCPSVKVEESLLLPQVSYSPESSTQVKVSYVAHSIVNGYHYTPNNVRVEELLFFDSFQAIKYLTLHNIFTHHPSINVVPLATVTRIHSAVEICRVLHKWLEDKAGQCRRDITYSQLYRELIKYSIFTDGSILVSYNYNVPEMFQLFIVFLPKALAGAEVLPAEIVDDPEANKSTSTGAVIILTCIMQVSPIATVL